MTEYMMKYKKAVLKYLFVFLAKPDTTIMSFKNMITNHALK